MKEGSAQLRKGVNDVDGSGPTLLGHFYQDRILILRANLWRKCKGMAPPPLLKRVTCTPHPADFLFR